jgi:hypothetical protein
MGRYMATIRIGMMSVALPGAGNQDESHGGRGKCARYSNRHERPLDRRIHVLSVLNDCLVRYRPYEIETIPVRLAGKSSAE